jgi:alkylation response protein AidB-like acyl-CoA dehydrogenase
MAVSSPAPTGAHVRPDWSDIARALVPRFAERATAHDSDDWFVADNYADLRERRILSAGVPLELGGGGASHPEMCEVLRTLAHGCGSTALALSMHTHTVLTTVWRWRHANAPVEPLLRRIAAEELILVTSGGSDWLLGSGRAEKVEGGFRIHGRKVFASGSPVGQLFMTMAVLDDPTTGPTVLHVAVPFDAPGVRVHDNWRALGMRGTGSHDVTLDGVFVPDAAVGIRRPRGRWSPEFHVVAAIGLSVIFSVYVGIAEAARDIAVREATRRRDDAATQEAVGALEVELRATHLAVRSMIDAANRGVMGPEVTNEIMLGRTLAGQGVLRTVEAALDVAGGAGFFRGLGLERLFRDAQGARYHPLRGAAQRRYAGRLALGLDVDG